MAYDGDTCIAWPYSRIENGYGVIYRDGKNQFVHRLVCEIVNGAAPTPEHQAAHSCGNGRDACVTKQHLSWKTPKENNADKLMHKTQAFGERCNSVKLTEAEIQEIRALKGKLLQREIGERFGVCQAHVSRIHLGTSWGWL